jgi:serine/threonine protein kinase
MEDYVLERKYLDETEAVFYLKQIMAGFMELHSLKIMHRDFKLANIFMHQGSLIIGDFGFAKAGAEIAKTRLGTPYNMAPEILFSSGYTPYTNLTDIWSIGVVYFQMLYGNLPFPAYQLEELKQKVRKYSGDKLIFPTSPKISDESKDLLRHMLQFDPTKRITWKQFFTHKIFGRFTQESFYPEYSVDSMSLSLSKFENRNINEDNANPFERASLVAQNFENAKSKAMLVSDKFELPQPIDLEISAGRLTFGKPRGPDTRKQSTTSMN